MYLTSPTCRFHRFAQSNSSREVRDRLVQACTRMGVTFRYNTSVEGIRRVPSSGAGPAALQDAVSAVQDVAAAQSAGEFGTPDGPSSSSEEEDRGGERLASGAEARLQGKDGRGPRRRPTTTEPPQPQRLGSGGWECELKDGARHRCDRLVSRGNILS